MIHRSIQNPDLLKISDAAGDARYFGCNQEWYKTQWQRLAGCGPSTVANILRYLEAKRSGAAALFSRKEWEDLMEECWRFVTPTVRGVNTTRLLRSGVSDYVRYKSQSIRTQALEVPKKTSSRPDFGKVLRFLDEALERDTPVAFLNLHHGEETILDSWHWVTIISLSYEEDEIAAQALILDESTVKRVNLRLWFDTTRLGGGFVRFLEEPENPFSL